MKISSFAAVLILFTCTLSGLSFASDLKPETDEAARVFLQKQWAINNYQLQGDSQKKAFERLVEKCDKFTTEHPGDASVLVWSGIVKSTYAGVKGGLGALKYAKASKVDLEKALALDPGVLDGSAYTSLGTLYFKVPGWPIGFGDDDKAEELLKKALSINPDGIDPNFFYAEYLREDKRYTEAREHLQRARKAEARPGREIADKGRQKEINAALASIDTHL